MKRLPAGFSMKEWQEISAEWSRITAKVKRLYGQDRLNQIALVSCEKERRTDEHTGRD